MTDDQRDHDTEWGYRYADDGHIIEDLSLSDPDLFRRGVAEGWADPETDPTRIDWTARQLDSVIPFGIVDGRPVNPCETPPIRYGRGELGHWGELQNADALVFTSIRPPHGFGTYNSPTGGYPAGPYVLLVERADGHGWALPGGAIEDGESPVEAASRELAEETGLVLSAAGWRWETQHRPGGWFEHPARYVPDPRATCESWMVTTVCECEIVSVDTLPIVTGADDARRAEWIRAGSYEQLTVDLAARFAGHVFAAHVEILRETL